VIVFDENFVTVFRRSVNHCYLELCQGWFRGISTKNNINEANYNTVCVWFCRHSRML